MTVSWYQYTCMWPTHKIDCGTPSLPAQPPCYSLWNARLFPVLLSRSASAACAIDSLRTLKGLQDKPPSELLKSAVWNCSSVSIVFVL